MKQSLLIILLCTFTMSVQAKVRLPHILSSHMVLQQQADVTFWGWANPGEKVTITTSWDTTAYTTQTGSGAGWQLQLKTPTAGGPYTVTIKGDNTIAIEDVLIGEVWVCGGQSNMEWSGDQKLKQSIDEAPKSANTAIRFFYVPKATSSFPQEDVEARWVVCDSASMIHFSAIGYFFGKQLQQQVGAGVGLINSNWGGTPAETWTPADVVNQNPFLSNAAAQQANMQYWPVRPAIAYNAMIYPLTRYAIAGAIWYQGESNTKTSGTYDLLFTSMIDAWRLAWGKAFPFYFVQIAPFKYGDPLVGALLREAQTKAANHPNTGMAVIADLVNDTNDIHPALKKEVAFRLANLAVSKTYNRLSENWESPQPQQISFQNGEARIIMKNTAGGLINRGDAIPHFEMAGVDRKFVPATATIRGDEIIVVAKGIDKPVAVRYLFSNTAMPTLFNKMGLPVNLFRSDNW
ncbi:MAG: sialate O-acetylesterase [Sediminibacterium sp.]|nr:sialate O-acetylesterase [Sediminibacterium sp.]